MKWTDRISVAASIATIAGVLVGIVALVYAYLQYDTYREELGRKPDLTLEMFFSGLVNHPMVRFPNDSSRFSDTLPLRIKMKNTGTAPTEQVDLILALNDNIKIVNIEYHVSGIEPILDYQLFSFRSMSFPLPKEFPGIPLMTMTVRLKRSASERSTFVGRFTVFPGGSKGNTKGIYFNPNEEKFSLQDIDDSKSFDLAPLELRKGS